MFERSFGPLVGGWKYRVLALAAEAKPDWRRAEEHWRCAAGHFARDGGREGGLSAGIIHRHIADLAGTHREIMGDDPFSDPVAFYLRESLACDPEHLATALRLMKLHRETNDDKAWHALAEETARRFHRFRGAAGGDQLGRRLQEGGGIRQETSVGRSALNLEKSTGSQCERGAKMWSLWFLGRFGSAFADLGDIQDHAAGR